MIRCILFGNMCSGKTSVGQLLASALGWQVVSAKDAVAKNFASASEEVKALRRSGHLLPDEVISRWILGAVALKEGQPVILDGFPRTAAQATALVGTCGGAARVVYCDFPLPVLERRFRGRVLCSGCGLPSNTRFEDFEGRCVLCGGSAFAPRETDRPDYLKVKTQQFESESLAVLPVLRAAGMKFLSVQDHPRQAGLQADVHKLAGEVA